MVESYTRFEQISSETSGSDSESSSGPRTEEGLLRAFIFLHERRKQLDGMLLGKMGKMSSLVAEPQFWPLLSASVLEYDDICARVLSLDGVENESSLRSLGHRVEVSFCRLAAARALQAIGSWQSALEHCTQAIMATKSETEFQDALFTLNGMAMDSIRTLQQNRIDALLLRCASELSQGDFGSAHKDALEAHGLCSKGFGGGKEQQKEALEMALRCEVALHGGAPGEDGRGLPMSQEDVQNFHFEISQVEIGHVAHEDQTADPQIFQDLQDLESMD
eukprot:Skav210694  [mRNA]  locus=scaffold1240:31156:31986:+ [translate_table: standard]